MINAIFVHNNGYDAILVPDGSFLTAESKILKDFIDAGKLEDDFKCWHGEDFWADISSDMKEAAKEMGTIVAYYEDMILKKVDQDLWGERLKFYELAD